MQPALLGPCSNWVPSCVVVTKWYKSILCKISNQRGCALYTANKDSDATRLNLRFESKGGTTNIHKKKSK